MPKVDDEITVRNLQVEYDHLTKAIPTKASELSLIFKDIEKAKAELNALRSHHDVVIEGTAAEIAKADEARQNLEQREQQSQEKVSKAATDLKQVKDDTKEATRELARLNASILTAQEEYNKYVADMETMKQALTELDDIVGRIKTLKLEIDILEEQKRLILEDISTSHEDSEVKLKEARDELATLVRLADEKTKEAEQAEYRVKTYTDELYKHMNDYQIVKSRLEGVWKKTFPELELPLE